ncbi:MAG: FMN-binding protein [Lachnospiraceae bacterium]
MKYKNFLIRLLSLVIVAGALAGYNSIALDRQHAVQENENKIAEAEAYNESITALENAEKESEQGVEAVKKYRDGTWEGTGTGFGGEIRAAVTVENGEITGVEILSADSEDSAYFNMAKVLTDRIVEEQSTEIDTVSGATYSSKGILEAALDALNQAENAQSETSDALNQAESEQYKTENTQIRAVAS